MRLLALTLGLGGLAGAWWTWWTVFRGVSLAFRWWVELYVEPYVILGSVVVVSIIAWEEVKKMAKHGEHMMKPPKGMPPKKMPKKPMMKPDKKK